MVLPARSIREGKRLWIEKRPVVKEELRISKDVVQDEELVEDNVRREEVEIEDYTECGTGLVDGESELDDETKRHLR
jgi:stress response protein YsnF